MRHGLALGVLAFLMRLGRSTLGRTDGANFPTNDMHERHEVMTSGRTVEIANGK